MANEDYRPRLSAELRPEQAQKLFAILPFGWQKPLFQIVVDGILELYDKGGIDAISAIVSKSISIDHIIRAGITRKEREGS